MSTQYPRKNDVTAYVESTGEVLGTHYSLSDAYTDVIENHGLSECALRVHQNGTIIARVVGMGMRIETAQGMSRSFTWCEGKNIRIGSREKIIQLSCERMGLK